jgi:hypothetical protein
MCANFDHDTYLFILHKRDSLEQYSQQQHYLWEPGLGFRLLLCREMAAARLPFQNFGPHKTNFNFLNEFAILYKLRPKG